MLLTGEVGLPGLYPITGDTGLDAVLAAAGGASDTAETSPHIKEQVHRAVPHRVAAASLILKHGNLKFRVLPGLSSVGRARGRARGGERRGGRGGTLT